MTYPELEGPLYFIPLALGSALMAAGVRYSFDQPGTGSTFGVPPAASPSPRGPKADVFMSVAGIRTFLLGGSIVAFALLRDRRATGVAVLHAVLVPLADGVVAFRRAKREERLGTAVRAHWGPAVLAGWLAYNLLVV